jgi:hypothetical protein
MPHCPQCNRNLAELTPRCPTCQADLGLLVDYVSHLQGGLQRAENLTRAGELGQAMWAYLEVLEVDPDNPAARRQVAQVASAVRQFDQTAPGRRWLQRIRRKPFWHRENAWRVPWIVAAALIIIAFAIGYSMGTFAVESGDGMPTTPHIKPGDNTLGGAR